MSETLKQKSQELRFEEAINTLTNLATQLPIQDRAAFHQALSSFRNNPNSRAEIEGTLTTFALQNPSSNKEALVFEAAFKKADLAIKANSNALSN